MTKLKVALLYGGQSGEHEISLRSARNVFNELVSANFEVLPIGMDKSGLLFLNSESVLKVAQGKPLEVKTKDAKPLPSLIQDGKFIVDCDVVFPVVHGPLYEDGALQGVLELADVAYVGCDVVSSAVGMDKDIARRLAVIEGVQNIRYHRLPHTSSPEQDKTWCKSVAEDLDFPLFVKPCKMGSSVGVARVDNMNELLAAVNNARKYDLTVSVEAFIDGREIELGVLEHDGLEGLPDVTIPGEITTTHTDGFYSYSAKYVECDTTDILVPAELDDATIRRLQVASAEIFMRLHCVGLARIDFFLENNTNTIYFNEVNTIPGFTSVSMFPMLWEASGVSLKALLERLIQLAVKRHQCKQALVRDFTKSVS